MIPPTKLGDVIFVSFIFRPRKRWRRTRRKTIKRPRLRVKRPLVLPRRVNIVAKFFKPLLWPYWEKSWKNILSRCTLMRKKSSNAINARRHFTLSMIYRIIGSDCILPMMSGRLFVISIIVTRHLKLNKTCTVTKSIIGRRDLNATGAWKTFIGNPF